jgi:hypothetical protein
MRAIHLVLRPLVSSLIFLLPIAALSADVSATWLGGIGNWSNALQWDTNPNYPNNNSVTYDATINSGAVTLNQNITIQRLFMHGGALDETSMFSRKVGGGSTLTLNEGLTMTGGTLFSDFSSATINLGAGSTSTLSGGSIQGGTLNNAGTFNNVTANGVFADVHNLAGGTWNVTTSLANDLWVANNFENAGTLVLHGNNVRGLMNTFHNSGTVVGDPNATFELRMGGVSSSSGSITVGKFVFTDMEFFFDAGAVVNANTVTWGEGGLHVRGNTIFNAGTEVPSSGFLEVRSGATLTLNGSFKHLSDTSNTNLAGGTITSATPINIQFGKLSGSAP